MDPPQARSLRVAPVSQPIEHLPDNHRDRPHIRERRLGGRVEVDPKLVGGSMSVERTGQGAGDPGWVLRTALLRLSIPLRLTLNWSANVTRRLAALFTLFALAATAFAGCGGGDGEDGGVKVVATTAQIGALAREVAGVTARVVTLIPPGVDSHDYEASTSDLKAIREATLLLRNGVGLDDFLDGAIESAGGKKTVVTVTAGIELHPGAGEEPGASADMDPHVWHDPLNAKVMVANIAEALAVADPAHAEGYRANAAAYQATLDETDKQIRALIDGIPAANRKLVTNHDAFGYFIRRYGLTFVGAVIPSTSTQAEPSAKDIAALVDLIRKENVKAIFAESSVDPKVADQIAKDTGVKIVDDLYGDSLGEPGSGAETVHGMLLANARKIAEALK